MQERVIHISSINRQKIGKNKPEDFIVKFDPVLQLDPNIQHEMINNLIMTYSWHNINEAYKNNLLKYSPDGGNSWKTINFVDGMYSYEDLELYIHQSMEQQGDVIMAANGRKTFNIKLFFVSSSYRVVIELEKNFRSQEYRIW